MSEKHVFEAYHDPDYSQFEPVRSQLEINDTKTGPETKNIAKGKPSETRIEAIRRIIEREFQQELNNKEHELNEINKRLDETKKLLHKVRYAIVYHYYNQKHLICNDEEITVVQKCQEEEMTSYPPAGGEKQQMAIHPSLKKLLGKRPIDYNEILKSRPTRKAAQNATEQFYKMNKKPADTRIRLSEPIIKEEPDVEIKRPRYLAPSCSGKPRIQQVNSARGRNIYRHLLVVGNISKYIGEEEADLATNVTHKWLIYVSTKTSAPVDQIVSRARFFLHESYKPNDVIEVSGPPFQISKRGWGEFPVRVQLYFHDHLVQKPLQIYHTLILDKKHTGLQTMGAETIVELWLNISNTVDDDKNDVKSSTSKESSSEPSSTPSSIAPSNSTSAVASNSASTSKSVLCRSSNPSPCKPTFNLLSPYKPTTLSHPFEPHLTPAEICVKQEPIIHPEPSIQPLFEPMAMINPALIHQMPVIKQEPMIKQEPVFNHEPMDIVQPTKPSQTMWPNGYQSPQLTPVKVKTAPVISAVPQLRICDQNNTNSSTLVVKQPTSIPQIVKGKKTFVKCVGKDGKVSLMELVRDEKNPKLFKMVLPPGVHANKIVMQPAPGVNRPAAPIVVASNLIRPTNTIPLVQPVQQLRNATPSPSKPSLVSIQTPITVSNQLANRRFSIGNLVSPSKTLPNQLFNVSNPVQMPKLVAINSPHPTTSGQLRPIPRHHLIQKTNPLAPLIQKNNKVLVLDSNRLPKSQQQSLLRPQVSLLKPRPQMMTPKNLKKITFNNISGMGNKNINIFVPADVKLDADQIQQKSQPSAPVQHRYGDELEKRFLARKSFENMTEAIGWLLKEIPLISILATQTEFKESFPFVVPNLADFHSLLVTKQRSFEWLRAKYINRLASKHTSLKELLKWSTKDIVLFGRWFGYTPKSVQNLQNSTIKTENEANVRENVKSELMKEHLQNNTISFNTKITKWLDEMDKNVSKGLIKSMDNSIIVVDEDEDELKQKNTSPLKINRNLLQLPIQSGHDVIMWINDICRRTQTRFEQEEIVEGVLHRSAEVVFSIAIKSFLEDFLRKCCGNKACTTDSESSNMEINNDDVLRTISSIQRFDFLTNKNLGIGKHSSN